MIGTQWWLSTSHPIPQLSTIILLYSLSLFLITVAIKVNTRPHLYKNLIYTGRRSQAIVYHDLRTGLKAALSMIEFSVRTT